MAVRVSATNGGGLMNISVVDDIGRVVGGMWQERQMGRDKFSVAAPLSSTPLPIYDWVVANGALFDWSGFEFVLMDEQVEGLRDPFTYVDTADAASYERFSHEHFLDPLRQVTGRSTQVIKPDLARISSFDVPIDLLVLAIGPNGNYANVMPGTSIETGWHIAALSDEFRSAHTATTSESYAGAQFRSHGMSLGPQQVLQAGAVVVVARGTSKSALVERLLECEAFDPDFPISIVCHANVRDRVDVVIASDVGVVL